MKIPILCLFSVAALLAACSDTPKSSDAIVASTPSATLLKVPSEYSSIQAAVDAADNGDTILVAPGTYSGTGNRDIIIADRYVTILSASGPALTVIDCGGSVSQPHFGFQITGKTPATTIDGFTIRDAYAHQGAAIFCQTTSPLIRNCVFYNNHATVSGGAIRCKGASPRIVNCTFVGNAAPVGGALQVLAGASPTLERCILALSYGGGAVYSNEGTSVPRLSCCLVYGNVDGNWVGRIADQMHRNGNLEIDPMFCDPDAADFHLLTGSPCLPVNNHCGVLIGALGQGCN